MSNFALEANQLTKFHGEHPALRQVTFAVRPGEAMALLGHNGAGKTTLLNLLALVSRPSSGSLRIGGVEMRGAASAAAKASIGLLGHQTFLYDELTARENVEFFARLYGVAAAGSFVHERLEAVGLAEARDELVRHFSRGMRQRLAVARTFLHAPRLVLLDEPFTGLDESGVRMLSDLIRGCCDEGRAVVLSSHDVALAARLASSVLVLERGRVKRNEE